MCLTQACSKAFLTEWFNILSLDCFHYLCKVKCIIIICLPLPSLHAGAHFISWPVTHLRSWTQGTALGFTPDPAMLVPSQQSDTRHRQRIPRPAPVLPGRVSPPAGTADPGGRTPCQGRAGQEATSCQRRRHKGRKEQTRPRAWEYSRLGSGGRNWSQVGSSRTRTQCLLRPRECWICGAGDVSVT